MFVVYSNEAKTPFFEAHKLQIMGKFTDEESQNSYDKNRYKFEEIINFLLAENIKPINKDNNLSDIYSISYEIDNERINFYNKLKDKYKIVNF